MPTSEALAATAPAARDGAPPPTRAGQHVLRVLHVLSVADSLVFLRGQAARMRARGARVGVVSSPGPLQAAFAADEGADVASVDMPRRITPLGDLRATARLVSFMRRWRPDVVDAHTPKGGLLGMLAAWLARVPVRVYHLRGLPLETATGVRRMLFAGTERVACGLAHRVVAVSPSLRAEVLARGLCRPERVVVLGDGGGDGIDAVGEFAPEPGDAERRRLLRAALSIPLDAPVVGFVGRLAPEKGVAELAAAWRRLRERHPAARLVVVGPLEAHDPLPSEVLAALRRDPTVHLLGAHERPRDVYPAFDVVALPTYREGFPVVVLEASALGLPVVATRVTGCVDAVVDGETGTLVPPRDPDALAAALETYLGDAALRARHGAAARARTLASFDRDRLTDALLALYRELLAERGRAEPAA